MLHPAVVHGHCEPGEPGGCRAERRLRLAPTPAPFTCLLVHVEAAATHRVEPGDRTCARPETGSRKISGRAKTLKRGCFAAAVAGATQPPPLVAKRHCNSTVPS